MIFLVLCLVAFGVSCASIGSNVKEPENKDPQNMEVYEKMKARNDKLKTASSALTLLVVLASFLRRD